MITIVGVRESSGPTPAPRTMIKLRAKAARTEPRNPARTARRSGLMASPITSPVRAPTTVPTNKTINKLADVTWRFPQFPVRTITKIVIHRKGQKKSVSHPNILQQLRQPWLVRAKAGVVEVKQNSFSHENSFPRPFGVGRGQWGRRGATNQRPPF